MRLHRLEIPDEGALRAFARLNANQDFDIVKTYLFDQALPIVTERLKLGRQPVDVCWDQGAAQTLDDLRRITTEATEWLGKMYAQRKKEGTTNV